MIIGALILIYALLKYRTGGYIKTSTQQTISGEESFITDEELRKNYNRAILMFIFGWAIAAISAPFLLPDLMRGYFTMTMATFSIGTAFGLIGLFFIFMYKTNPEWYRAFIAKRKKK